ncbi:hypothetical protein LNQ03_23980 [Klebsiella pneumoniae subsp. pneumoniae]|nr:hypothetical protein [Klebsiella pneumoniae subsp. pneumoniae]
MQQYAAATPIVDMVRFSPAQLDAEALIGLLRPLTPRLYSYCFLTGGSGERGACHRGRGAL